MSTGNPQKCRLFLEGREVPFVAATLSCNIGETLTATIDLVPTAIIKFIKPKTSVVISVKDPASFGDHDFHTAFEGEVSGRSFGKAQDSRYFRILAKDNSAYWDQAMAYFYNHNYLMGKIGEVGQGGTPPDTTAKAAGASVVKNASTSTSQMITLLLDKKNKDLVDGVMKVIKSLSKSNLLYKTAYSRLRVTDRIRMRSSGNLKHFLQELKLEDFLAALTGSQGGLISVREMLLSVMRTIFHDFVSVPFASRVINYKTALGVETPVKEGETIGNFLLVPDGYSLPPPRCNTIFPNHIKSFDFGEDFDAAPTRFMFRASFPEAANAATGGSFTYQAQYYPTSFGDYMRSPRKSTTTPEEDLSLLGASALFEGVGKTYSSVKYGGTKSSAVGGDSAAVAPTLREADFMTAEESIRGIVFTEETLMPGMTSLTARNSASSRVKFTQEIGKYLFFKKRFGARNASAQLRFHPFLVPGFNCYLVDDSDAGQTVMAKLQSVSHNLTNEGFATTVSLGYARDFDEVDALTGEVGDPPLPAWFDGAIFGKVDKKAFDAETLYLKDVLTDDEIKSRNNIKNATCFTKLSDFYQYLLGCDAVTNTNGQSPDSIKSKSKLCTSRGAAYYLSKRYKGHALDPIQREKFVQEWIFRKVPTMADTFFFLGAKPVGDGKTVPDEFAKYEASSPSSLFDGKEDATILAIRRQVIDIYVAELQQKRGFRG